MSNSKKLATFVHVDGQAYGPDDKVPADVAKRIVNPKAWADGSAPDDSDDSGDSTPVKPPTKAEMLAEIEKRNADRSDEDKIVPAGEKNADLAAALKADDEKSA